MDLKNQHRANNDGQNFQPVDNEQVWRIAQLEMSDEYDALRTSRAIYFPRMRSRVLNDDTPRQCRYAFTDKTYGNADV